jgi:NinB protein
MSRALIVLRSTVDRQRAMNWISKAPFGTRLTFQTAKRTLPQNDRLWAMLTDVASQHLRNGRRLTPETWKCLFMQALGRELQCEPSLDGEELVPIGFSSSNLSKSEMSDLIDFIAAWGAENGVRFHDDAEAAA